MTGAKSQSQQIFRQWVVPISTRSPPGLLSRLGLVLVQYSSSADPDSDWMPHTSFLEHCGLLALPTLIMYLRLLRRVCYPSVVTLKLLMLLTGTHSAPCSAVALLERLSSRYPQRIARHYLTSMVMLVSASDPIGLVLVSCSTSALLPSNRHTIMSVKELYLDSLPQKKESSGITTIPASITLPMRTLDRLPSRQSNPSRFSRLLTRQSRVVQTKELLI